MVKCIWIQLTLMKNILNMSKNIVIINAGGIGTRFGNDIPKQFTLLNKKPIIQYCLELYQNNNNIDSIFCVCDKKYHSFIADLCKENSITKFVDCCECGVSANESRYMGIKHLDNFAEKDDIVILHDAVRILTKISTINNLIDNAKLYGCSTCGRTINANIFLSKDNMVFFDDNIPSNSIFINDTPLSCRYDILKDAFYRAKEKNDVINSSGPSGTVAKYSHLKSFPKVECDFIETVKITFKEDLDFVKKYLTYDKE